MSRGGTISRMLGGAAVVLLLSGTELSGSASGEIYRLSLSPRMEGAGFAYGSYDVFRAFVNPAMLANQPRTWEIGMSEMAMFAGGENLLNVAAGWGGQKTEAGTFGGAMLFSAMSMAAFEELDELGNSTGTKVAPAFMQVGMAGLYQWEFVSLGVQFLHGQWGFGSAKFEQGESGSNMGNISQDNVMLKLGTTMSLGKLDLGVSWTVMPADAAGIGLGLAFKSKGWFNGQVGLDCGIPFSMSPPTNTNNGSSSQDSGTSTANQSVSFGLLFGGGIVWNASKWFDLRMGYVSGGKDGSLRFGFTVPWRDWSLDYAFRLPINAAEAGMGMSHMFSLGWSFGADRKPPEGPKFFIEQKERTMAVANFEPQNVSAGDSAVISDMLRNKLINEGTFNIVEKANMDKVLSEQAFQQTGCTSQECAVKLGKILNVRYLVVGSFGKVMDAYMLSMRVIDVETAKAIYSDEAEGKNLAEMREGIKAMAERLTEAVKKQK